MSGDEGGVRLADYARRHISLWTTLSVDHNYAPRTDPIIGRCGAVESDEVVTTPSSKYWWKTHAGVVEFYSR